MFRHDALFRFLNARSLAVLPRARTSPTMVAQHTMSAPQQLTPLHRATTTPFGPTSPSSGVSALQHKQGSCNIRTKKRKYDLRGWIEYPFTPDTVPKCPVPGLLLSNFQSHSLQGKDTLKARALKIHENHQVSTCLASVFKTTTLDVSNPIVNVKEQMNVFGDDGKSRRPIDDLCVGSKDSLGHSYRNISIKEIPSTCNWSTMLYAQGRVCTPLYIGDMRL